MLRVHVSRPVSLPARGTLSGVQIGRAGVTAALDALSLPELIHDRGATDEVVSRMLAYMNQEAAAPGDDGMQQSVSFEQFRSVMSQLGSMEAGEMAQDLCVLSKIQMQDRWHT